MSAVDAVDWVRVKLFLIEKSEIHSRTFGAPCLTHEEWKELAEASMRDRGRYVRVLTEVTGKG